METVTSAKIDRQFFEKYHPNSMASGQRGRAPRSVVCGQGHLVNPVYLVGPLPKLLPNDRVWGAIDFSGIL